MSQLTHINESGEASMVDVTSKGVTERIATARSVVLMSADTLSLITNGGIEKGDVFAVARVAGIQAAKKCGDLIPLCHPLALTSVSIDFEIDPEKNAVIINSSCKLSGKTGVEMEALTAASVAALTIYDMCKASDKGIVISETLLLSKSGGKSGDWVRNSK